MAIESPGLTLELTRVAPARRAEVFELFTEADQLAQWWGPQGFTVPSLEFDPRPGASYRIEMQPPEGAAFFLAGQFREVDPPTRLAYTFRWEDPDPDDVETEVRLTFRESSGGTQVGLSQGAFKTEARRELHRGGWTDSFDKLEALLSG